MKRTIARLTVATITGALSLGAVLAVPAHAATHATVIDSDRDGMPDSWERTFHLNSRSAADAKGDPDHDGLGNLNEFKLHGKPNDADTDNDGSDDGDERRDHTRPDAMDTDRDGRRDGNEDADHDSVLNEDEDDALEACISDDSDTDHDGVSDEDEDELRTNVDVADTDHDGVSDGQEDRDHDGRSNEDEDDHIGDRCHHDGDHDGVEDEDENDLLGTITSFDAGTGVLVIATDGDPLTLTVTATTRIKWNDDVTAPASSASAASTAKHGADDPAGSEDHASIADLKPGTGVSEVEYHHGVLDRVELIPPVAAPSV